MFVGFSSPLIARRDSVQITNRRLRRDNFPHLDDVYLTTLAGDSKTTGSDMESARNASLLLATLAQQDATYAGDFQRVANLLHEADMVSELLACKAYFAQNPRALTYSLLPTLASDALRTLDNRGEVVLALCPFGAKPASLAAVIPECDRILDKSVIGHRILVHIEGSTHGNTSLSIYNLGAGAQHAVEGSSKTVISVITALRVVGARLAEKSGKKNFASFKIPACLRIELSQGKLDTQALTRILELGSMPDDMQLAGGPETNSARPSLDECVDAFYEFCKSLGRVDLKATQRFGAPQGAMNCLHKSVMAFVANQLPEPAFRLFRYKLLEQGANRCSQTLLPRVQDTLNNKAARAKARYDQSAQRPGTYRCAADLPRVSGGIVAKVDAAMIVGGSMLGAPWLGAGLAAGTMLAAVLLPLASWPRSNAES